MADSGGSPRQWMSRWSAAADGGDGERERVGESAAADGGDGERERVGEDRQTCDTKLSWTLGPWDN